VRSTIAGYKLAKYWDGGKRRGEREETSCKLTASLGTRTKKFL
jgi:hypothetical protein